MRQNRLKGALVGKRGGWALALTLLLFLGLFPAGRARADGGKTVRVGWAPRPHVSEEKDGVYSGYNYDFLMELQKYTGWEYEFVPGDVETLTAKLEAGEIDLLGTLLYSEARAERLDFASLPYGEKYTILLTSDESPLAAYDFSGYDGLRIGALRSDAGSQVRVRQLAVECGFSCTVTPFDTEEAFAAALYDGRVDAGVVDAYCDLPGLRILAEFAPVPYYFATTKGNMEVLQALNRALLQLNLDRPYIERELYDVHFGVTFNATLTERELAIVTASRETPVTVGVIPSSAPACYWDEERGEYVGIFMEILKAVSQKTGLVFAYVPLDLAAGAPIVQLRSGAPDIVAGVLKTQRFMDDGTLALSDVLLSDSIVLVGREQDDFSANAENRTIALPAGFQVAEEYVTEKFPVHRTALYPTVRDCLDAVVKGEADAAVYTRSCMNYLLHDPHYEDLELIPAYDCDVNTCAAGLFESRREIIEIIDKGLAMISENERNSIMMNTTIMNPYRTTLGDLAYKYRAPLAVILLLLFAVIGVLLSKNAMNQRNEKRLCAAHEQELAALEVARQASAAKGNFMSCMSHEIRTPLNAVIGYNTLARGEMKAGQTEEERKQSETRVLDCLVKSELASKHLLAIINDVLDMAAIESGKIQLSEERFDLNALLLSVAAIFNAQADAKNISFTVVTDPLTETWFVGSRIRTNQVLTNLLSNAVKFTPRGGTVRLTVRQPEPEGDPAHVRFLVEDTGIGMETAYLRNLFTPFEQADSSISRRFGGTGLGLSITKSLVDRMGGSIAVASAPGQGTTFTVDLTFQRTEQPDAAKTEAADRTTTASSFHFEGAEVLLAEDNGMNMEISRRLLEAAGLTVTCAWNGEEAVRAFESASPWTYRAILMDVQMPVMDGHEATRRIRALPRPDAATVPILAMTADAFLENVVESRAAGMDEHISKPVDVLTLLETLAKYIPNHS